MKNPLSYQITEYDCGPTSFMNAISFLFKREEIPPDIIKHIMLFCLDAYNGKGELGKSGTSQMAVMFLSNWLNQFGKAKRFPVCSEYITGEEVFLGDSSRINCALQQGGAVVVRVRYGCWHYVLLTGIKDRRVCVFDPYYRKKKFVQPELELVTDCPYSLNRLIPFTVMNAAEKSPYALGPLETREAMVVFNRDTQKTAEQTIEYFI